MARQVKMRGYFASDFPCVHIAYYATEKCEQHPNYYECPDIIIAYNARFNEYAIAPRGGSGDDVIISHCPWCGQELPASKRHLWFSTLESMGLDPAVNDIPEEFTSNAWWKQING